MRHLIISILLIISFLPCFPQDDRLHEEILTAILEQNEDINVEEISDLIYSYIETPIDINSADEEVLNQSGLFTPFQVYGILTHREKYGIFFSIYELTAIPGFRKEYLELISRLLTTSNQKMTITNNVIKILVLSNISCKYPYTQAYFSNDSVRSIYPGNPVHSVQRIKGEISDKWSFGLVYEKDPGEKWFIQKQPEHFVGYTRFRGSKNIKEIIVGNFRIHSGAGLVHGTVFQSDNIGSGLNGYRNTYAKPMAATSEYDYYRGIYTSLESGKLKVSLFGSVIPQELSLYNYTPGSDLYQYIRKTGLHRTRTEIAGIRLGRQFASGVSISRVADHWNMGIISSGSMISLTQTGLDSLNSLNMISSTKSNLSFYGVAFGNRYELFGEFAMNGHGKYAALFASNIIIHPALSLLFSIHRYQDGFTGQIPSAPGNQSTPENETGIHTTLLTSLPLNTELLIYTDISKLIILNEPGDVLLPVQKNGIRINIPVNSSLNLYVRVGSKRTIKQFQDQSPGNGLTKINHRVSYRFEYRYQVSEKLSLRGRIEYAQYSYNNEKDVGTLMYQQASYKNGKGLNISYRYLLFNVGNWNNRIYVHEPGVRYSFTFPALNGQGSRNLFTFSKELGNKLTFRGKTGLTIYSHMIETGSGIDTRPGNYVLDIELQLQLNL